MSDDQHDIGLDGHETGQGEPAIGRDERETGQGEPAIGQDRPDREPSTDGAAETNDAEATEALRELEQLISRLEGAAEQLRSGDLSTDAAATLVEECAVLANRAGAELDRLSRAGHVEGVAGQAGRYPPAPGQDSLL